MSIKKTIERGLDEDLGKAGHKKISSKGDITSNYTIPVDQKIKFQISNREPIVICGVDIALLVFEAVQKRLTIKTPTKLKTNFKDGDFLPKNSVIIEGFGNARVVFAAERLALNFMQHLSGIATRTKQCVDQLHSNKTKILDTRKTIPSLRVLQKYAVKTGGGDNHRMALYDRILIKDNHIAAAGSIALAVKMVRTNLKNNTPIEIECDNLEQVKEALKEKAEIIMLDNMNLKQIKKAVKLVGGKAKIEVSGGINLEMIKEISKTGVDYISIGALTHSVKAADIGLDIAAA